MCGLPCEHTGEVCNPGVTVCNDDAVYTCDPIVGDVCPDGDPRDTGDPCEHPGLSSYCGFSVVGELKCTSSGFECSVDGASLCMAPGTGCGLGSANSPTQCQDLASSCSEDHDCAPGYYCTDDEGGFCRLCDNDDPIPCWGPTDRSDGCLNPPSTYCL